MKAISNTAQNIIPHLSQSALVLCFSSASIAQSIDNEALNFYCANNQVEYETQVTVGAGTRISLNQGVYLLVEDAQKYQPTQDFIKQQMVDSGISSRCSEFLLTRGQLDTEESGEVIARVFFSFDNSQLTEQSKYVLAQLTERLASNNQHLLLEGHTDSIGSEEYNFSLGLQRSQAVEKHLQALNIANTRLTATSAGETAPNSELDSENRRVEISFD